MNKILHSGQNQGNWWPDLFKDCTGITQFNKRLEKQIFKLEKENDLIIKTYNPPTIFGDGLEIFTCTMFQLTETNKRFGVLDYTQVKTDNGHDGEGWKDGLPQFVQVKNTHLHDKKLTASGQGLDSPIAEAMNRMKELGIPERDEHGNQNFGLWLVTFGDGLHHYTENEKHREIDWNTVGNKALKQEFDNNKPFWNKAYEMVALAQPNYGG
tara:strand:+ start:49 stop:681 length:633 start_codon:yes stop_codon:yes gene_type:complete